MTENRKIFSERLRANRLGKQFSQPQIAEKARVKTQVINDYEHGRSAPSFDVLIRLADALDVSLDYLTGRTDDVEKRGEHVYPQFADRLKGLRTAKGIDIWRLADLLDISPRNYAGYEIGEAMPDLPVIAMFADYFDVSLDYLVGRSDDPEVRSRRG